MRDRSGRSTVDVNSTVSLLSIIYLAVIGASVFIVQPGFVQGLVAFYGFGEQQAGYIASVEVWGIALTTVVLALGGHNYSWQKILRVSVILFAVGNLASLVTAQFTAFAALRFLTGLGAGGLVAALAGRRYGRAGPLANWRWGPPLRRACLAPRVMTVSSWPAWCCSASLSC